MAYLTELRRLVYERDKYTAGWGAPDGVSMAYVRGHTCAVDQRSDPPGQKRTDARPLRHGYGNGRGHGGGNGGGHGGGNGNGYANGYANGYGDGDGHGHGTVDGYGYGGGLNFGNGDSIGFAGQPWQI